MSDELEALKKRVTELENQANPVGAKVSKVAQAPFDPTANFKLPPSAVKAMSSVVTDADMADLRRMRDPSLPTVGGKSAGRAASNWVEPKPLENGDICRNWGKK